MGFQQEKNKSGLLCYHTIYNLDIKIFQRIYSTDPPNTPIYLNFTDHKFY